MYKRYILSYGSYRKIYTLTYMYINYIYMDLFWYRIYIMFPNSKYLNI